MNAAIRLDFVTGPGNFVTIRVIRVKGFPFALNNSQPMGRLRALMKLAMSISLLCAALLPVAAQGSLSKLERLSISGADHVRLEDWARANNFQARWTVPKQELKLTSSVASLSFTVDSAKVSVNGIHVWLSAPISRATLMLEGVPTLTLMSVTAAVLKPFATMVAE